jgi:hypothetical protein
VILDFNKETFDKYSSFARIGGGSIGGKARGLGFINNLLSNYDATDKFKDMDIFVPTSVVIGTEIFDYFLEKNDLLLFALECEDDNELVKRFLAAPNFSPKAQSNLREFLELIDTPLAVRSSSLLEDSQGQPFAGVYDTHMLPNNHQNLDTRLTQLINTIKIVYASTFSQKSKDYIKMTSYRLEEEKMAVIIQKTVGRRYNNKFYPEISGVAKSYNFYPTSPLKSTDGIVSVALGMGKMIVEGGSTLRFCPKYPHHLLSYSTIEDTLQYSQQEFFAIEMDEVGDTEIASEDLVLKRFHITEADKDGTLPLVASTYSKDNNAIYDGTSRDGMRIFTLAPILKFNVIPLPQIIEVLLELGRWGMGSPVEIEFAVNLYPEDNGLRQFGLLQLRPLVISNEIEQLDIDIYPDDELICKSEQALGNGVIDDIHDVVFVDINEFDRSKSTHAAQEISKLNSKLVKENRPYLLIGVGRWGTLDPWLGIPVTWEQISGAKTIIETNFKDFDVQPSQGTHFFQNLTSFKVGYFTVNDRVGRGFVNWEWLSRQKAVEAKTFVRHLQIEKPITIKINGQENRGVILKPEEDEG